MKHLLEGNITYIPASLQDSTGFPGQNPLQHFCVLIDGSEQHIPADNAKAIMCKVFYCESCMYFGLLFPVTVHILGLSLDTLVPKA